MSESAAAAATPVTAQTLDFSDHTDADLLERMALAGTSIVKAPAAFAEFHRRHAAYLSAVGERRNREEAEEFVAETFRRVYESAPQFDCSSLASVPDADATRRLVRAWVGQIPLGGCRPLRRPKSHPLTVTPDRITSWPEPRFSIRRNSRRGFGIGRPGTQRGQSLRSEQDIAWTMRTSWSPEHGQVRWSEDDLNAIAVQFGLSRENIRQVRARLIRKLRTRLEPSFNGSPADR